MRTEKDTAAVNEICISIGLASWAAIIAAPLQMAGVIWQSDVSLPCIS